MKKEISQETLERYLVLVGKALEDLFPEADIIFFGSVVEGDFSPRLSDIDVGLYLGRPLTDREYWELQKVLEDLPLLRAVDVVDLASVKDPRFLKRILEKGRLWKGSTERLRNLSERCEN